MGGNVRLGNIKAEQIPIGKIGRTNFMNEIRKLLLYINSELHLWDNEIIYNGYVFNGSTTFVMNPKYTDQEILSCKKSIGDVDVTIPRERKRDLVKFLNNLKLYNIKFQGLYDNERFEQLNCIFTINFKKIQCNCQIDFEMVDYENNKPTEWSKFSHCASFEDAKQGIKAVFHKFLIGAMTYLTASDFYVPNENRMKDGWKRKMIIFDVNHGWTLKYKRVIKDGVPLINKKGKEVYTRLFEEWKTDINELFKLLFNLSNTDDINKFWSFVGLCDLMNKYLDRDQILLVNDKFYNMLYKQKNHYVSKDIVEDKQLKDNAYNYFKDTLGL